MNRRSVVLIRDTVLVIFDFTRRSVATAALEEGVQHVGNATSYSLSGGWRGVRWGGVGFKFRLNLYDSRAGC